MAELEKFKTDMGEQHADLRAQLERLSSSEQQLKDKLRTERETSEGLRSEKVHQRLMLPMWCLTHNLV